MKVKSKFYYMALVLLIITSCTQKQTRDDSRKLADSLISLSDSVLNSGDYSKVASLYTSDIVFISYGYKMAGKDSVVSYLKRTISYSRNLKNHIYTYAATKDMVFTQSYFTFDWNKDKTPSHFKGIFVSVWQRQADRSWKLTFAQEDHF